MTEASSSESSNEDTRGKHSTEADIPNDETMEAVQRSRAGMGEHFESVETLFDDLGI